MHLPLYYYTLHSHTALYTIYNLYNTPLERRGAAGARGGASELSNVE